jgi:hypothetical protein
MKTMNLHRYNAMLRATNTGPLPRTAVDRLLQEQDYLLTDVTGDDHRVRVVAPLGKLPCPKN